MTLSHLQSDLSSKDRTQSFASIGRTPDSAARSIHQIWDVSKEARDATRLKTHTSSCKNSTPSTLDANSVNYVPFCNEFGKRGSEIWGWCDEISQSLLSDAAAPQSFRISQHAPDARIFEAVTLACTCQLHLLSRLTPSVLRVCCLSVAEIPFNDICLSRVSCHATFHLRLQKCTITFSTTSGLDERWWKIASWPHNSDV